MAATKKLDLSKYALEDLKALKKDVEKAIADFQKRKRSAALKEMQAIAKKHGVSVEEVFGGASKARKAKSPAKYRNPENTAQEWSGRGRQPGWFKAALQAGKKPEALEI